MDDSFEPFDAEKAKGTVNYQVNDLMLYNSLHYAIPGNSSQLLQPQMTS